MQARHSIEHKRPLQRFTCAVAFEFIPKAAFGRLNLDLS